MPAIHDRRPGRFVRHLDFNHFRTIGMRRLVGEGFNNRFVTGGRLEEMLKVRSSLISAFFIPTHSSWCEGNAHSNYIWCDRVYGRGFNVIRT